MNPENTQITSKSEQWSYRIILAAIFLAPIAFLPVGYVALDLVKTVVIVGAVVVSVLLRIKASWQERK